MRVTLINHTADAINLLLFTKNTRLTMSPGLMKQIEEWPEDRKMDELAYMARTLPSSWEFVNYVFLIEDVTRAFTHQLVRTRTGHYAQQAQRVVNVAGGAKKAFGYETGPTILDPEHPERAAVYHSTMAIINQAYTSLLESGAKSEDARGLLPTNVHTNIVAMFSLRTMSDLMAKRGGVRTQDEYRSVLMAMIAAIYNVHPWATLFLEPRKHSVVDKLEDIARRVRATDEALSNELAKEADILKKELAS